MQKHLVKFASYNFLLKFMNIINLYNFFVNSERKNIQESSNTYGILLFKEQFKYLKTTHSYHLVDPSPWPLVASLGAFMMTTGLVLYMHRFFSGWSLFINGFVVLLYVMYTWWRDVIREATFEDQHTAVVQKGLRLGMILFIASEVMFFFAFLGHFFIQVYLLFIILEAFGHLKLLVP